MTQDDPTEGGGSIRHRLRRAARAARWLSPAGFALVALCFLLPFVAVSCDAPGGFGRVRQGGTTAYTGLDLAAGSAPNVTEDRLRPPADRRDDRLAPQLLAVMTVATVVAGAAVTVVVADRRRRRAAGAAVAAVAAVFLTANQATVTALLAARLREQLTAPLPTGREAGDYVKTQNGFWIALLLLVSIVVVNAIGLLRERRRSGPSAPTGEPAAVLNAGAEAPTGRLAGGT